MPTSTLTVETGPVGLGTFPLSGVFRSLSKEQATGVVESFLSLGGRYIETAPSYPPAKVELRSVLAAVDRSSVFIATKCVTGSDRAGNKVRSGKRDWIREQVGRELDRLGLDRIDLLQTHITPPDVEIREIVSTMLELQSEGIVGYIGCSNVTLEELKEFNSYGRIHFVQNRASLIHRTSLRELTAYCQENDISINPYQVVERGLLTDSTTSPSERREGDLRSTKAEYVGEPFLLVRRWVERDLAPIASELGTTVEALVTAWLSSQPAVSCCVIGATTPRQVAQLFESTKLELSQSDLQTIESAYELLKSEISDKYGISVTAFRGLT